MKLDLARLPDTARLFVDLFGLEDTLVLVRHYGCRTIWPAKSGAEYDQLVDLIGEQKAAQFVRHFREYVSVPKCDSAIRAAVHAGIRAEFDRLTMDEGLSAREAVARLAGQPPYNYTDRHIWRVLSEVDAGQVVDAGQGELF